MARFLSSASGAASGVPSRCRSARAARPWPSPSSTSIPVMARKTRENRGYAGPPRPPLTPRDSLLTALAAMGKHPPRMQAPFCEEPSRHGLQTNGRSRLTLRQGVCNKRLQPPPHPFSAGAVPSPHTPPRLPIAPPPSPRVRAISLPPSSCILPMSVTFRSPAGLSQSYLSAASRRANLGWPSSTPTTTRSEVTARGASPQLCSFAGCAVLMSSRLPTDLYPPLPPATAGGTSLRGVGSGGETSRRRRADDHTKMILWGNRTPIHAEPPVPGAGPSRTLHTRLQDPFNRPLTDTQRAEASRGAGKPRR